MIIVAHGWPDNNSGYGIATSSTIAAMRQKYLNICYVGVTESELVENIKNIFPNIEFRHLSIKRHSLLRRFISSSLSSLPACVQQFRDKSLYYALSEVIEEYKSKYGVMPVVIFEGIPIAIFQKYLKKGNHRIKTVVRSHDVLFEAFSNFSKQGNFLIRIAWTIEVAKVKYFELRTLNMADLVWSITARDANIYKKNLGVDSNGVFGVYVDIPEEHNISKVDFYTIISLVTIDYRKEGGLRKFIEQDWPRIKSKIPHALLILGGQNTESFNNTSIGIRGLGYISDVKPILENGFIFLNTQDSGSGIKIKSLIAMAWGKLLVSTRVGIQGIEGIHGKHFLCGNESKEFSRMIIDALENPVAYKYIIKNGYDFVKKNYCKEVFLKNCLPLVESM